jgi:glycosyltransferase involved in cell wall biosynthesis
MKILVLSNYDAPFYSVRPEAELFIGLKKCGHDITVMSFPKSGYREKFISNGIKFLPFHPLKKWDSGFIRELKKELQGGQYDIVHAFNKKCITNAISAIKGSSTKLVTYRGVTGYMPWYDPTSYLSHLHSRVDAITCVSQSATDYLQSQLRKKDKVFTVYKGHNVDWYEGILPINLKEIGIPDGSKVGICVANIRKMKGLKYLLEATNLLGEEDHFHLLLVGNGMDQPEFQTQIEQSFMAKRIHSLGFRRDVLELIRSSDFLVLPSIKGEGLPKVVIEAMVQEVVPIASRVGGCPELIEDGVSGVIIEPGSAKAIAEAIRFCISSVEKMKKMGSAARIRIKDHFNVEVGVTGMENAYQQILRKA